MSTRDNADIIGGTLLFGLGAFVSVHAYSYDPGTMARIGPGLFPTALGVLLAGLGVFIAIPAFFRSGERIRIEFRPLLCVVGSLVFFALALRSLGLIPTSAVTILLASLATNRLQLTGRLSLVLISPFVIYAIFVLGLQMNMRAWPTF